MPTLTIFITVIRALSVLMIALTLLPLLRSPRWWIRVWDYPRLQLATAIALLLIAQVVSWRIDDAEVGAGGILLALATFGACLWQAISIWPYTRIHRVQSLPAKAITDDAISVMVSNVLQDNRNADGLIAIVNEMNPDILITLETNQWWDTQLRRLDDRFPHTVRIPLENTYGMHVLSQLELRDVMVRELVSPGIPSVRATVRLRSGNEFELHAVHPEPPLPQQDVEERDAELLLVAREVEKRRRPALVAGDLNDVAWSHSTRLFQRTSRLLDPRVGRGIFATFHTEHALVRWPLDHLFHDAAFRLVDLRVLPSYGSDHFPIYTQLVFDPSAAAKAREPRADAEDQAEASEKIAEGTS